MTPLIVLGMHRSGTSALAGLLSRLGVAFGRRLMPGGPDNPKGYYEHPDIVEFNDRLLYQLQSRWDDTTLWSDHWWSDPGLKPVQALITQRLAEEFTESPLWGLKDPRLCRLLPAWGPVFAQLNAEPFYLLMLRHPLEVAASLQQRDGFSETKALLLWLQYTLEAERHSRGKPRRVLDYADLCRDWRAVAGRIQETTGSAWPRPLSEAESDIDDFISPMLRHHQAPDDAPPGLIPGLALDSYRMLRQGDTQGLDRLHRHLLDLVGGLNPAGRESRWLLARESRIQQPLPAEESRTTPVSATAPGGKVDIIVPVYRGLEETRRCLDSVLASRQETSFELTVIDDCSPEPELRDYLRGLAQGGRITLLTNDENLGFAGTVNRGLEQHPDRDAVLLNSDTLVANDWLDRLRRCAWQATDIGTVTPFSNNAAILSYPRFMQDNRLPEGWSVAELDRLFRSANAGGSADIPTGVGFCLYLRRDALNQVGLLDTQRFRAGYGEENDLCMRAWKQGWRNRVACDTFVYHKGGVSFDTARLNLQDAATSALGAVHPEYTEQAGAFIAEDPLRPWRYRVDQARGQASLDQALGVMDEWRGELDRLWRRESDIADRVVAGMQKELDARDRALTHAQDLLAQAREAVTERDRSLAQRDQALAEAQGFVQQREADLKTLQTQAEQLDQALRAAHEQLAGLREQLEQSRQELALVYASRSWRYTKIFRRQG